MVLKNIFSFSRISSEVFKATNNNDLITSLRGG
jgi:hypothetical protein